MDIVKEEFVLNIDYMSWLEKFMMDKTYFCTTWAYSSLCLEEDSINVNRFSFLYRIIDNYAKENLYYSKKNNRSVFYSIKYNDNVYEVGVVLGPGTYFFCNKVDTKTDYIDFSDIINNVKRDNLEFIKNKLYDLYLLICSLDSKNIPLEAISETTDTAVKVLEKRLHSK